VPFVPGVKRSPLIVTRCPGRTEPAVSVSWGAAAATMISGTRRAGTRSATMRVAMRSATVRFRPGV
jgi:hypothetical protein